MNTKMPTTTISGNRTVLAKEHCGELYAKAFANRTQAKAAAKKVNGQVIRGIGRPFYVMVSQ